MSILVRAIYQTREFEEDFFRLELISSFRRNKVLRRAGGKDAVSYLRIISQKFDDLALERIIVCLKESEKAHLIKFILCKLKKLCLEPIIKMIEIGDFKPKIKLHLTN